MMRKEQNRLKSIETIALDCLVSCVFCTVCVRILATDKQTDKQMGSIDA